MFIGSFPLALDGTQNEGKDVARDNGTYGHKDLDRKAFFPFRRVSSNNRYTLVTTSRSPRTCWSATSSLPRRTGSGSPTSPTSRLIRAGSIWQRLWTSTAARSSVGRWQIICAPHFHWRP